MAKCATHVIYPTFYITTWQSVHHMWYIQPSTLLHGKVCHTCNVSNLQQVVRRYFDGHSPPETTDSFVSVMARTSCVCCDRTFDRTHIFQSLFGWAAMYSNWTKVGSMPLEKTLSPDCKSNISHWSVNSAYFVMIWIQVNYSEIRKDHLSYKCMQEGIQVKESMREQSGLVYKISFQEGGGSYFITCLLTYRIIWIWFLAFKKIMNVISPLEHLLYANNIPVSRKLKRHFCHFA